MKRPSYRARIQWRTWAPWYELSRQIGEWQAHNDNVHGALTAGGGVAASTLIAAVLAPTLTLPTVALGGLLAVAAATWASPEGRRLVAGLTREGLPSPRAALRLAAGIVAADARSMWYGRCAVTGQGTPLLIEGPGADGDARDERDDDTEGEDHDEHTHDAGY